MKTWIIFAMVSLLALSIELSAAGPPAVVVRIAAKEVLRYHNVRIVFVHTFDDLLANLKEGRVDAVVYDAPPLMYAAKLDPTIKVVGETFAHQRHGIVFPNTGGEALKERFDIGILASRQSGDYQKIYDKWF